MISKAVLGAVVTLFLASLVACESAPRRDSESEKQNIHSVSSYGDSIIAEKTSGMLPENTLFVFDIDNTLLQSPAGQLIGSDQWYKWQKSLAADAAQKVNCVLQMQGAAYYMAHLEATEAGLSAQFVEGLQRDGYDVIALTARSPQFRSATERELSRSDFDFSVSTPLAHAGFPGSYEPARSEWIDVPRAASYQNGVAMLAGQHKGGALIDLLSRLDAGRKYRNIVFFDDDAKNTNAMAEALAGDGMHAAIFLYSAVNTALSQYDLVDTQRKQAKLEEAFEVFDRDTGCDM